MIHDLVLRWVVSGLFVLSAAECGFAIITHHRRWTSVLTNGLHFVMAVAMVVMVWPWGAQLPTTGPAIFFLLAALWFVSRAVAAAQTTAHRGLYGYHGLMMLATAWMYAIMNGDLLALRSKSDMSMPDMPMSTTSMPPTSGMTMPPSRGMSMPPSSAMTMPSGGGMNMPASSGPPLWFTAVGWIGTLSFAAAAVFWTYWSFIQRRREEAWHRSLASLCQAMMAAGMAIFFLATLFSL
jgi:Domain of unknown function (DUF5134)